MLKAVVEIGTNSIKYCLAEVKDCELTVIKDINKITKLGEGLAFSEILLTDAIERTAVAVESFVRAARAEGAAEIKVVGTMALRRAKNAEELKKRVERLTNINLLIISGEEEARLSYLASLFSLPNIKNKKVMTFDIGGGSTDIALGDSGVIERVISMDLGIISLTEKYFVDTPISQERLEAGQRAIDSYLKKQNIVGEETLLVGIGGTVTSLASIKEKMALYDSTKIHGIKLTYGEVELQIRDFASKSIDELRNIIGLNPDRAETILAGACIVLAMMKARKVEEIYVSDRGLRHALFF